MSLNAVSAISKSIIERIAWDDLALMDQLSKQKFKKGNIHSDSNNRLDVVMKKFLVKTTEFDNDHQRSED